MTLSPFSSSQYTIGNLGVKSQMPWFKTGSWTSSERIVFYEFTRSGIEAKLVNCVWPGVGHECESIRGVRKDGVCATLDLDSTEFSRLNRAIRCQRMIACHAATVTSPELRFPGLMGGYICCVCADVGCAKWNQFFLALSM